MSEKEKYYSFAEWAVVKNKGNCTPKYVQSWLHNEGLKRVRDGTRFFLEPDGGQNFLLPALDKNLPAHLIRIASAMKREEGYIPIVEMTEYIFPILPDPLEYWQLFLGKSRKGDLILLPRAKFITRRIDIYWYGVPSSEPSFSWELNEDQRQIAFPVNLNNECSPESIPKDDPMEERGEGFSREEGLRYLHLEALPEDQWKIFEFSNSFLVIGAEIYFVTNLLRGIEGFLNVGTEPDLETNINQDGEGTSVTDDDEDWVISEPLDPTRIITMADILDKALKGNPKVWCILNYKTILLRNIATPDYNVQSLKASSDHSLAGQLMQILSFTYKGGYWMHEKDAQSSSIKEVQDCLTIALGTDAGVLWTDDPVTLPPTHPIKVRSTNDLYSSFISAARSDHSRLEKLGAQVFPQSTERKLVTWLQFLGFFEVFERSLFDSLILRWKDDDPINKCWVDFRVPYNPRDPPSFARVKCLRFSPVDEDMTSEEYLLLINVDTPFDTINFPQFIFHLLLEPETDYRACFISGQLGRILKTTLPFVLYISDGKYRSRAKRAELLKYLTNIEYNNRQHSLGLSLNLDFPVQSALQFLQKKGEELFSNDFPREDILEDWSFDTKWHLNHAEPTHALKWKGIFHTSDCVNTLDLNNKCNPNE